MAETAQWSGTSVPSRAYHCGINCVFWFSIGLFKLRHWLSPCAAPSIPLRAINDLMAVLRRFQVAELDRIRVPFLGVLSPIPAEFTAKLERVGGMDFFVVIPSRALPKVSVILYVHGGGFVSGDFGGYRSFVHKLAERANIPLVFPHYRLAPEHDVVDQVADVLTALRFATQRFQIPVSSVIMVGDSAGGALTLLSLQRLAAEKAKMPQRAILMSPVTDLSCSGKTFVSNRDADVMLHPDNVRKCMDMARTRFNGHDPAVSPLFGDFVGLPPLYFLTARTEIFADDTRRAAAKAQAAGVATTVKFVDNLFHVFPLFYFIAPECAAGLDQIAVWVGELQDK